MSWSKTITISCFFSFLVVLFCLPLYVGAAEHSSAQEELHSDVYLERLDNSRCPGPEHMVEFTGQNLLPLEGGSVIVVTTEEDELNDDGDCSLREAVQAGPIV